MRREARREIVAFGVLFLSAFLLVSLYTRRPEEALLLDVWQAPVQNGGGPLGALAAHHIESWLGLSASYALVLILGLWGLLLLFRRKIEEPGWKVVGVALFLLAISTFEVAVSGTGSHPDSLPGGYYGQFCYGFLISRLERFGAYLMVFFALLVALLVGTDAMVYPAIARAGHLVLETNRWRVVGSSLGRALLAIRAPLLRVSLPRMRGLFGRRFIASPPAERVRVVRPRPETPTAGEESPPEAVAAAEATPLRAAAPSAAPAAIPQAAAEEEGEIPATLEAPAQGEPPARPPLK